MIITGTVNEIYSLLRQLPNKMLMKFREGSTQQTNRKPDINTNMRGAYCMHTAYTSKQMTFGHKTLVKNTNNEGRPVTFSAYNFYTCTCRISLSKLTVRKKKHF